MNYKIKQSDLETFFEISKELEELLTERIEDLHEIKGMMQCRHAYTYYRSLLWDARRSIENNTKDLK